MGTVVRKFNYKKFIIFILIVVLIIVGIIFGIKKAISVNKYHHSIEYALLTKGYEQTQIDVLQKKLNNDQINELLKRDYNELFVDFVNERYFLYKNLDKYLEYKKENTRETTKNIVAIINTESNIEWMDEEKESDTSKEELMLVNRLYSIGEYEPENITRIPEKYAFSKIDISSRILSTIEGMLDDMKEEDMKMIVSSGYRSYESQEKIYNNYKDNYGTRKADEIAARPGHSEYQTGLTFELTIYGKEVEKASESDEYKWLKDNAFKYGFVFRHPSDKEKITKFEGSLFKLRYVGLNAAQIMHDEDICFEEYYAFYVIGEKNTPKSIKNKEN